MRQIFPFLVVTVSIPVTGAAFTQLIFVFQKVWTIKAGDLLARWDGSNHNYGSHGLAGNLFDIGMAVVVHETCRSELIAFSSHGIHHAEVIHSSLQHSTVGRSELCYAAQQDLDALSWKPVPCRGYLRSSILTGVSHYGLYAQTTVQQQGTEVVMDPFP